MNAIQTKHNLDFEACQWPINPSIALFRVGTCHGQYYFTKRGIKIISIINDHKHNGHLEDVFQWFEYAAKTQRVNLIVGPFLNHKFKKHCIRKRGFTPYMKEFVIKRFSNPPFPMTPRYTVCKSFIIFSVVKAWNGDIIHFGLNRTHAEKLCSLLNAVYELGYTQGLHDYAKMYYNTKVCEN